MSLLIRKVEDEIDRVDELIKYKEKEAQERGHNPFMLTDYTNYVNLVVAKSNLFLALSNLKSESP